MSSGEFEAGVRGDRARIEAALERLLPAADEPPGRIHEAMRYAVFAGGKRLRPLLALLATRACGGDEAEALVAGAAIEMIHTYSLVHDDLPAMDDDRLRRGRPTTHVAFDEATAVLTGDALLTRGFEILAGGAGEGTLPPALRLQMVRAVAAAVNSTGMIGGQVLDLMAEGQALSRAALEDLHRRKTGALITAAAVVGGLIAGYSGAALQPLADYGAALGLGFQVTDDILDVTGSDERLGKSAGKDARARKSTFPGLFGLDGSRREAGVLVAHAVRALEPFGAHAEPLRALARFVLERDH